MSDYQIVFSGSVVVPFIDVQHIENIKGGIWVITKHTKYNFEMGIWENPICISDTKGENKRFYKEWYDYLKQKEN